MMAHILCPGPSLAYYDPSGRPDLVIAVNRAAAAVKADFWSMLDAHTFEDTATIGFPDILCGPQVRGQIRRQFPDRAPLHVIRDKRNLVKRFPEAKSYMGKSFFAAIWLAVEQGATEIQCRGADFVGTKDWDGHTHRKNKRDDERWDDERGMFMKLRELLAERDVRVYRMGPAKVVFA